MTVSSPDKLVKAYSRVGSANHRSMKALTVVLSQFRANGIAVILLKGADVLPRLYGVWGLRPMVDVDLLVREHDLPTIDRILKESGHMPQIDGNPAYHNPDHTLALDLVTEIWYADDHEGIWQRAVPRNPGNPGHPEDPPVLGMGADDLLIYLTAYTVLHRGYFAPTFPHDLALLARKEPLNWDFILEEAGRCNLKIPLHHGLSYAARRESIPVPDHVWTALAPASPEERFLSFLLTRLVTDRRIDGISHFLLFITRPGWEKWQWLRQYFLPSPAFLKYRYGERGATRPIRTRLHRAVCLAAQALRLSAYVAYLLVTRRSPATP